MSTTTVPVPMVDRIRDILQSNWREDEWFGCDSAVIFHYAMKAAVCERFAPRRIIEIGTRCGYSLLAFHAVAPRASYLCIDGAMDNDSLYCLAHAKRLIERHQLEADLVVVDSHAVKSLPADVEVTHVSLFDGSNEGLRLKGRPVFSVQYHPEASPGPEDSHYLFDRFVALMDKHA